MELGKKLAKLDNSVLTFSTRDVARLSGAALRQLQHWTERSYIPGVKVARHCRRWNKDHVRKAAVLAKISESGTDVGPKIAAMEASIFHNRFLLFTSRRDLICATDSWFQVLKAGSTSSHGLILVDLAGVA